MTDYSHYLVDCSGRSGALQIERARFIKAEDVLDWIIVSYHEHCTQMDAQCLADIKWKEDHGLLTNPDSIRKHFAHRKQKGVWYDDMVKCYPIDDDGRIIKDHYVMRDIWMSCEDTI